MERVLVVHMYSNRSLAWLQYSLFLLCRNVIYRTQIQIDNPKFQKSPQDNGLPIQPTKHEPR